MFRRTLLLLSVLFAAVACDQNASRSGGGISPGDRDAIRLRHVDAVNAIRIQAGLTPVQLSAELNAAAETHARDMAVQQRAWHFGSDMTSPRERAFRAGYRGELVGENISEGADSDLTVLKTWLDFADTRAVIVDPAARGVGLGWYEEESGKTWWVQVIGQ
ncbi:CAP domain-containing protein [Amaricoccus tamworthensis]|uniref:CAP domain-containing protein n=1 Tax=Amaricoccus tamworthensis TaxID=57002 RepID=UPI003C7C63FA